MVTRITATNGESVDGASSRTDGGELEPILDDAFEKYQAKQHRGELRTVAHIVSDTDPQTVVEIGTATGGSLCVWSRYFDTADTIVSVDKDHTPGRTATCRDLDPDTDIHCVDEVSQTQAAVDRVRDHVRPDGIDFLYIDGGSTEWEVQADYDHFVDDVSPGGIVAFHDIRSHLKEGDDDIGPVDVHEVWDRVRGEARRSVEIVAEAGAREYGYGLMYL